MLSAVHHRSELVTYVSRIGQFSRRDWLVYAAWVGLMVSLCAVTGGFLALGHAQGARFPSAAYLVALGEVIFTVSIAVDTIGHRTIYKAEIREAEGLVHGITIFCGIGSCVLLSAAYRAPELFWIPAMVLTVMSVLYSLIDEAFHWRRYVSRRSDRVEMWSHVGIFVGHGAMMLAWWAWFFSGYRGVAETLALLSTHG
ncbi:MAG TPA: hypothetical protein VGL13_01595 [Polyangiaceae bacterium]